MRHEASTWKEKFKPQMPQGRQIEGKINNCGDSSMNEDGE
jgi:hypothetical protein